MGKASPQRSQSGSPWLMLAEDKPPFPKDGKELSVSQWPGPTAFCSPVQKGAWLPVLQGLNKTVH